MLKKLAILFCCAVLFLAVAASVDQWDKKTTVTFTWSVELPGIVLGPGTYVFKVVNAENPYRFIVGVFNAEETHLYTSILAIPDYRLTPKGETVLRFEERSRDMPEALRAWFYPGDNFGRAFVYPKKKATELAAAEKIPVLTAAITPAEKPEEMVKESVVEVTPEAKEVEVPQFEATRTPEVPPMVIAKAEPAPEQAPAAPVTELPKTGSPLPALILVGFVSMGTALVLRAVSKRIA